MNERTKFIMGEILGGVSIIICLVVSFLAIGEAHAQVDAGVETVDATVASADGDLEFEVDDTTPEPDATVAPAPEPPSEPKVEPPKPAKGKKPAKKGKRGVIHVSSPSATEVTPRGDDASMALHLKGAPYIARENNVFPKVWADALSLWVDSLQNPISERACLRVSGVVDRQRFDPTALDGRVAGGINEWASLRAEGRQASVVVYLQGAGVDPKRLQKGSNITEAPYGDQGAIVEWVDNCLPPQIELSAPTPAQDGRDGRDGVDGLNGSRYFLDLGAMGSFAGLWGENPQVNGIGAKVGIGFHTDWTYVRLGLGGITTDSDEQENSLLVDGSFGFQMDWFQLGLLGAYTRTGEALDSNWTLQSWGLGIEGVACTPLILGAEALKGCLNAQILPLGESWGNLTSRPDRRYAGGLYYEEGPRDWTGVIDLGAQLRLSF